MAMTGPTTARQDDSLREPLLGLGQQTVVYSDSPHGSPLTMPARRRRLQERRPSQIKVWVLWVWRTAAENELLMIQAYLNFFRDFFWTIFSYMNLDYRVERTKDDHWNVASEWAGQQIWATGAMVVSIPLLYLFYRYLWHHPFPLTIAIIYLMGAATAIFTWDRGQVLGIDIGQNSLGMDPFPAALFAALFTGGFEGPTQFIVITSGMFLVNHNGVRTDFKHHPTLGLTMLLVAFLLSIFPGMVPGTVWQLVYAGVVHAGIGNGGTFLAAISVAGAVCTCNILFGKFCDFVNAHLFPDKEGYDGNGFLHFHPDDDNDDQEDDLEDQGYYGADNSNGGTRRSALPPAANPSDSRISINEP